MLDMEPNELQRADLAARIRRKRMEVYGTRRDAYVAAGVNSSTWTRAETGQTLAERSLVAIMKFLWPETGGDWQQLDPPLGGSSDLENEILQSNLKESAKDELLRRLRRPDDDPPASEVSA
jgi:hypothetical protein